MNIFVLDYDLKACAQAHNNKHILSQLKESCQLLCSSHHVLKSSYTIPYKLSHSNHPAAVWTRESKGNYLWLCELAYELSEEYKFRYGAPDKPEHKCVETLSWAVDHIPPNILSGAKTPHVLCMPDEYKVADPVQSYRNYYIGAKTNMAEWKKRSPPPWWPGQTPILSGDTAKLDSKTILRRRFTNTSGTSL